jgi:hypothetical protein
MEGAILHFNRQCPEFDLIPVGFRLTVFAVEPIDPNKSRDDQFQAEYDALVAQHEAWEKYFAAQFAS